MIAIPLLEQFIAVASGHEPARVAQLRDLAFSRLRPALSLTYSPAQTEPELGASYLWGSPDISDDESWPTVAELSDWFHAKSQLPQGHHCAFIGQFAFGDMQGTVLGQELPTQGGFAMFAITEVYKLGITETLVRPWNNKGAITRRKAPHDLVEDTLGGSCNAPSPPHAIELTEVLSLPWASTEPFSHEIPGCGYRQEFSELYDSLRYVSDAELRGFGGYLRGTTGDDPSPDIHSIRFAVLRVTPSAGVVHFAIPAADLKEGRLDRVQYVWNDWDG